MEGARLRAEIEAEVRAQILVEMEAKRQATERDDAEEKQRRGERPNNVSKHFDVLAHFLQVRWCS